MLCLATIVHNKLSDSVHMLEKGGVKTPLRALTANNKLINECAGLIC